MKNISQMFPCKKTRLDMIGGVLVLVLVFAASTYFPPTDTFLTDLNHRAVKAFAETEERCRKILAECSEESTRQQLMHIPELVTHMQQGHSEQLKRLRETTNAVWKKFDRVIQAWKLYFEGGGEMLGQEME
ncbi:hypothetical protein L195_g035915 [Trifolium pratense]|uniref:Uncharacterized protein n=1 Tax=Trifolium pratense TaxID=57577 RepID=A0A2K3LN26_TRIPR|nr:hypothetical protein L195_g035915 [Trifolium pratense]